MCQISYFPMDFEFDISQQITGGQPVRVHLACKWSGKLDEIWPELSNFFDKLGDGLCKID